MIRQVKRFLIRAVLAIEIIVFAWIYCFGPRGLQVVLHLREQNKTITTLCEQYIVRINHLQEELADWREHKDFYYQKYTREKLHMAHPQDQVIFIS